MVMTSNENTRIREREEDKGSKSHIHNLGPKQQSLFLWLAMEHMKEAPEMSNFMKLVLHEKRLAKAMQLIVAQMRKWKGAVSVGALHRFLSSGFLSQEANLSEPPGGMVGFMFFSRLEMAAGAVAINQDKQRTRDYFDTPVEEECVAYYIKKEYFIPRSTHQLEIMLREWKDLLELYTVENSITMTGLKHLLASLDDRYQILEEMFKVVANFGLLIILSMDQHLQNFYNNISKMQDMMATPPMIKDTYTAEHTTLSRTWRNIYPQILLFRHASSHLARSPGEGSAARMMRLCREGVMLAAKRKRKQPRPRLYHHK
jgi:hypothetical protein